MRAFYLSLLILAIIGVVCADVYLQGIIKGSNNRLHEQSATRTNNNRLFNSQNNNRGGYNVGQCGNQAATADKPIDFSYAVPPTTNPQNSQYADTYYEGSEVVLAWTNQHGCGGNPLTDPHNTHCNIVIQYTCDSVVANDEALTVTLSNGLNTDTPETTGGCDPASRSTGDRGQHESKCWYDQCTKRSRNKGLFLADQAPNADDATRTRQNPGGNRSGLECDEERDYYPYWTPSPWRDVAYLTSELQSTNIDPCAMVQAGSQNVNKLYKCVGSDAALKALTAEECAAANGTWKGMSWNIPEPECKEAPWTRDNHLGATREGFYSNYTWTVPTLDQIWSGDGVTKPTGAEFAKCVVRVRYNITTADYDPWNTFSGSNGKANSPVTNDPVVSVGGVHPLQLAINTAQFGRTFQDRTHVFTIRKRPDTWADKRIVNLSLIGKRCNIVECYPAVEYYWVPTQPVINPGDLVHVQWTGSNTHNNGPNGGDGQTGDSGTGQNGSDHHNFVTTLSESHSFPIPLDLYPDTNLFAKSNCYRPSAPNESSPAKMTDWKDCAISFATANFWTKLTNGVPSAKGSPSAQTQVDKLLNEVSASLIGGIVIEPTSTGDYYFMSQRDNNFTNRDQKGVLRVVEKN